MTRYEEPVVTPDDGPVGGTRETHPAYAQIGVVRTTGRTFLYGSDFDHQHFMTVRIYRSELHRGLSNDWPHAREEYIEVSMSEAQWATFVASPGVGQGVQCTLNRRAGEQIPQIPRPPARTQQFSREAQETINEAMATLDALREQAAGGKIGKRALLNCLDKIKRELAANVPFVAKQFGEHMERVVEQAKTEVNAYVTGTVMRAGLAALQQAPTPIALPEPEPRTEGR